MQVQRMTEVSKGIQLRRVDLSLALRIPGQQFPASAETNFPLAKEGGGGEARGAVQSPNHVDFRHG